MQAICMHSCHPAGRHSKGERQAQRVGLGLKRAWGRMSDLGASAGGDARLLSRQVSFRLPSQPYHLTCITPILNVYSLSR